MGGFSHLLEASWDLYRKTFRGMFPLSSATVGVGYLLAEGFSSAFQRFFPQAPALRLVVSGFSCLLLGFSFSLLVTATSVLLAHPQKTPFPSPQVQGPNLSYAYLLSFFKENLHSLLKVHCLILSLLFLPYGLTSVVLLLLWYFPFLQSSKAWSHLLFFSLTGASILLIGLLVSLSSAPVIMARSKNKSSAIHILRESLSLVKPHWWRQLMVLILTLFTPLALLWCVTFPWVLAEQIAGIRVGAIGILLLQTLVTGASAPFSALLLTLSCLDLMETSRRGRQNPSRIPSRMSR